MISLHAYGKPVNSPFGLMGRDENALSFALLLACKTVLEIEQEMGKRRLQGPG